jgi:hypothetical protein
MDTLAEGMLRRTSKNERPFASTVVMRVIESYLHSGYGKLYLR